MIVHAARSVSRRTVLRWGAGTGAGALGLLPTGCSSGTPGARRDASTSLLTVPPTTQPVPSTTTTTLPEFLRSREGSLLQRFAYPLPTIEELVDRAGRTEGAFRRVDSVPAVEMLTFLPILFHEDGLRAVLAHTRALAGSGQVVTLDPFGTGEVVYRMAPQRVSRASALFFPPDVAVPPEFVADFEGRASYGSTRYSGGESRSVIRTDRQGSALVLAANYLSVIEQALWPVVDLVFVSADPAVGRTAAQLTTPVKEIWFNWYATIVQGKMGGLSVASITRSLSRTINVHTSTVPLALPGFDQEAYDRAPGRENAPWG